MRTATFVALFSALLTTQLAAADSTTEAAKQRLRARQVERISASTRPSNLTNAQVEALQKEISQLRREVRELKEKIAVYKEREAAADAEKAKINAVPLPKDTFVSRTEEAKKSGPVLFSGNTPTVRTLSDSEFNDRIKEAKRIDAEIQRLVAADEVTSEIATSMWAGKPAVGMTVTQLEVMGRLHETGQSGKATFYNYAVWQPIDTNDGYYSVTVVNGIVESYSRRRVQ